MNRTRDCVRLWGSLSTMLLATAAALMLAALAACGGAEAEREDLSSVEAASPARPAAHDFRRESEYGPGEAPGAITAAADGPELHEVTSRQPAAPSGHRAAEPVDPQARTRHGRYIGRAAAEDVDRLTAGNVVWLDADCCKPGGAASAEGIVFGLQAVIGEPAPIFVSGRDLRHAARVAERLHAIGLPRVHLVTP